MSYDSYVVPPGASGGPPSYGQPLGVGFAPSTDTLSARPARARSVINPLVVVVIALGAIIFLGALGAVLVCVVLQDKGAENAVETMPTAPPRRSPKPTPPADSWITVDHPQVMFKKPAGWQTVKLDTWGVFEAPDGHAVFTFTTFDRAGEATAKISEATRVLGVSQIAWSSSMKTARIGRDDFPAVTGEGDCYFRGANGYIWYATVNPGGYAQILLMYTRSARASRAHAAAAVDAIKSLRRR